MKIGMFTDTYLPQVNGVVTSIRTTVSKMEKLGHEVFIFAPSAKGDKKLKESNVYRFHSVPFLWHKEYRVVNPISKHLISLRKLKLDVIHSHTPFSLGLLALQQAKQKKIPLVHTYHTLFTQYVHYLPFFQNLGVAMTKRSSRNYCNRCQLVITPSQAMADELISYGVKTSIQVIPTGVDMDLTQKGNAQLIREENHLPPEVEIVSYAGRLAKEKNLEFLIKVFHKISVERPQVHFLIIGDGPQKKYLKKFANQLGLANRITFTGYVDKATLASWYKATDVFAFPSVTETQGLVVLEAMAMGKPVVAVNAMGVSDIIRENKGGFASGLHVEEFSSHVLRLLSDDTLRSRKAQEAKKQAEFYSATHMAENILNHYERLVDQAGSY